jgi:hypothetical protein
MGVYRFGICVCGRPPGNSAIAWETAQFLRCSFASNGELKPGYSVGGIGTGHAEEIARHCRTRGAACLPRVMDDLAVHLAPI